MKQTRYRENYEGNKLNRKLNECKNSIQLYSLFIDYKEVSHEESRTFRLINADTVISDLGKIIRRYNKLLKGTDIPVMEYLNLQLGKQEVEEYRAKKKRKSNGGHKADNTKKNPIVEEKWSDWCMLPIHVMSINYQYQYSNGKKIRSKAYQTWLNNFPRWRVPNKFELAMKNNVRIDKPFAIEVEVIQIESMDVDNGVKSLIDALVDTWGLKSDNHVQSVSIRRIGICEDFDGGMIRFRVKNV